MGSRIVFIGGVATGPKIASLTGTSISSPSMRKIEIFVIIPNRIGVEIKRGS